MDPLSRLCTSCGLCCDGNLFTQVPLLADEVALLRRRGLPLLARGDRLPVVEQRCAALAGSCCTIYDERPQGCRGYRCMLHAALAADEVGLEEALAVVVQTQALLGALADALPPGHGAPLRRARVEARAGTLTASASAAVGAAARQIGRHFDREAGRVATTG
ncbi:MAG: YkgJ family cysteine cluster protein [Nannocystis sp.]|uniref:YkgJ family cysteine cluster protein n=1 Tax=Nannocystis sp. TaxID=1962667 RepID=UPI00242958A4|nr:YkgJ family cysteine cluster protein [Nannocystis sp.]MBK9756037.1 YkgJ family cysteine cluster protein [Nannocystis sp.]